MRIRSLIQLGLGIGLLAVGSVAACSASNGGIEFGTGGAGGTSGVNGNTNSSGSPVFTGAVGSGSGSGAGGGPLQVEPDCSGVDPNIDNDGDGWTGAAGDCNDCTAQMNPGAQDYPGNNIDEDCNGANDDNPTNCDGPLDVASNDPMDGARAIGLCKMAQGESWGLVSAEYVTADGQPLAGFDPQGLGHGILNGFGPNVNPQEGVKLLALSSGTGRQPTDPGYMSVGGYDKFYSTGAPPGFPKESPSCPGVVTGQPYDSIGLRARIKTPTNALSMSFNLDFYTYEFPVWICTQFNDFFVAILTPPPAMYPDGNISFDNQGNLISVNAGFLEVCNPQQAGGKNFPCTLGPAQLTGTGYDEQLGGSAATGWLQTSSALQDPGGEITLLFTIWDSGDGILDSTVLIDNLKFEIKPADTETIPIPNPK